MLPRAPFPGMVIRYSFLWSREAQSGHVEARKDRPCVVVVAVQRMGPDSPWRVRVVPITHRPPDDPLASVPVPVKVKRHLGLDDDAAWIILDESNEFYWPGMDLRPVPRQSPTRWVYGVIPTELFDEIKSGIRSLLGQRRLKVQNRDE